MTKAKSNLTANESSNPPLISPNSSIELVIKADQATSAYNLTLKKLATKVKVPGFRQGKVPPKIAADQLNPEYVIEKALELVLPQAYEAAIKASNKKPISYPEFKALSVNLGEDWKIEAQFAEQPEIELKDYKKIVSQSKRAAEKEWPAVEKNWAKTEAEKHQGHDHDPHTPEEQKKEFIIQKIYSSLVSELKPQIPEILVKQEAQYEVDQLVKQLDMFKMKLEDFLARRKLSYEDFSAEITAAALGRLQLMFLIQAISQDAKISTDDSEIDQAISETKDQVYAQQQKANPEYRSYIKETLSRQKVIGHLLNL